MIFIALIMHFGNFSKIIPSFGPIFQGEWNIGHVERNRRIYDFELVYFAKGTTKVIFPEKVFLCQAGSTILIPPNVVHCSIALNNVDRWCIHFDWFSDCRGPREVTNVFVYTDTNIKFEADLCASAPENLEFPLFQKGTEVCFPFIRRYFAMEANERNHLIRQGLLLQILGLFLLESEDETSHRKNNTLILKVKERIDEEYLSHDFQIADIAAEMQVTPNHISRIFRTEIGCSITEYMMRKRFSFAKKQLRETNLSIGQIAESCGFSDLNYFCRFFRKQAGVSPGTYRKQ